MDVVNSYLDAIASLFGVHSYFPVREDARLVVLGTTAAILVVLLAVVLSRRKSKGDAIVLVGTLGAGKTALYFQLLEGSFRETQTSMKENVETFVPHALRQSKLKPVKIVDFPGHDSQRHRLNNILAHAKAVMFVLDAADEFTRPQAANFLFSLLTSETLVSRSVPVLVLCNKQDDPLAKPALTLQPIFEQHLDRLRGAQSTMASIGSSGSEQAVKQLGKPGVPFKFEHSACNVQFVNGSVRSGQLEPLLKWLQPALK